MAVYVDKNSAAEASKRLIAPSFWDFRINQNAYQDTGKASIGDKTGSNCDREV